MLCYRVRYTYLCVSLLEKLADVKEEDTVKDIIRATFQQIWFTAPTVAALITFSGILDKSKAGERVIHTYIHIHKYTYIHMTRTHIHIYIDIYILIYNTEIQIMHFFIYSLIRIFIHTFIQYIHTYILTYLHTFIHTRRYHCIIAFREQPSYS